MTRLFSKSVALTVLALALTAAGCGGGSDSDVSQFVGTWQVTGTQTSTCQGQAPATEQLTGPRTVGKGVDAPLVLVQGTCTLKMAATGNSATLQPAGQICPPEMDAAGNTYTATYSTGNFVVSGTTATFSQSGSVLVVGGGQSVTCMFTASGTATKVSM